MLNIDHISLLLEEKIGADRLQKNAPMKSYTTFKVGGPADLLVSPQTFEELEFALKIFRQESANYLVVGHGSNLLVRDKGFRGVILQIGTSLAEIRVEGDEVAAQGGALMPQVAAAAAEHSLTGLEFACGIPGSIGGGLFMNAGAYDGELKHVVKEATVITPKGEIKQVLGEDMGLGYRTSNFQKSGDIILEVVLDLKQGNKDEIKEKMKELLQRRSDKQPINYPSAGSTFKRPPGYFAGTLVQEAGCKGLALGGARVSPKHAGFIINEKNATAQDIIDLIKLVQATVYDKFGVTLETEVKIVGEE